MNHKLAANLVYNDLKTNGRMAKLVTDVTSGDAYNPTVTQSQVNIRIRERTFDLSQIDGTLIQASDKLFISDFLGDVLPGQKIADTVNGVTTTYEIKMVTYVNPGNTCLYKRIHCRR